MGMGTGHARLTFALVALLTAIAPATACRGGPTDAERDPVRATAAVDLPGRAEVAPLVEPTGTAGAGGAVSRVPTTAARAEEGMVTGPAAAYLELIDAANAGDWGLVYDALDRDGQLQVQYLWETLWGLAASNAGGRETEFDHMSPRELFIRTAAEDMVDSPVIGQGPARVDSAQVEGETATLQVVRGATGRTTVTMVREGGRWKVAPGTLYDYGWTPDDDARPTATPRAGGRPSEEIPCVDGYVWREVFPGDHVCVTPETRDQAAADNAQAAARVAPAVERPGVKPTIHLSHRASDGRGADTAIPMRMFRLRRTPAR